ncbi:MAG TPA: IS110 family transposase [Acidimicrobiia bacterium]|nr:IS110 family transposase [Acidimicrobiia bacterium]
MTTIADPTRGVILGVDTHEEFHVGVVIDGLGRVQATTSIPTTTAGYRQLVCWARRHGELTVAGIEGTGSYGAGVAAHLREVGVPVVEVNRPNRQHRRRHGKSDPTDAEAAARAVLSGEASATPKTHTGVVEAIRVLRVTRSSALKARTQAANQIRDIVLTAPGPLREQLRGLTTRQRVERCARFRPTDAGGPHTATRRALRLLARRHQQLSKEIDELTADLDSLVTRAAPNLLAHFGVGTDVAAKLLVTAGDNPQRLTNEAAFAALCGASPVPASSGKTQRHRLNRGGNRQANNALWTIAMVRLAHDPTTRAYADRRVKDGLTRRDVVRCLKRYIARQLYPHVVADINHANALT